MLIIQWVRLGGWEVNALVRSLVRAGANVNATSDNGLTPLAWAYQALRSCMEERYPAGGDRLDSLGPPSLLKVINVCMQESSRILSGDIDALRRHLGAQEAAYTRVVGGTFLDVTRMYLDFFELHGEPETDFRGDNLFALVSTLHRLTAGFSYPSAEADAGENDGGDGSGGDDSDSEDS